MKLHNEGSVGVALMTEIASGGKSVPSGIVAAFSEQTRCDEHMHVMRYLWNAVHREKDHVLAGPYLWFIGRSFLLLTYFFLQSYSHIQTRRLFMYNVAFRMFDPQQPQFIHLSSLTWLVLVPGCILFRLLPSN